MMAVQRMTLNMIRDQVLNIYGVTASTAAPWTTDANLYEYINRAGQTIPVKVAMVVSPDDPSAKVVIDFWRTQATSATTGSGLMIATSASTGYLPIDFYHHDTFYDLTNKKPLRVIENSASRSRHVENLKKAPAGPPEAIEILGMTTNSTNWQRMFTIWPSTETGKTPSVQTHLLAHSRKYGRGRW